MFSANVCHITPEHVAVVQWWAGFCTAAALVSLLTGKTYYRRVIDKTEEPWNYWMLVVFFVGMALSGWIGLFACPRT